MEWVKSDGRNSSAGGRSQGSLNEMLGRGLESGTGNKLRKDKMANVERVVRNKPRTSTYTVFILPVILFIIILPFDAKLGLCCTGTVREATAPRPTEGSPG
jgi:hypothetical protein